MQSYKITIIAILTLFLFVQCSTSIVSDKRSSFDQLDAQPDTPITEALQDIDVNEKISIHEIGKYPDGSLVARTRLLISFRGKATAGQVNDLLLRLGARITYSQKGFKIITIRIKDPLNIEAFEKIVAEVEAEPFVWFVHKTELGNPWYRQ